MPISDIVMLNQSMSKMKRPKKKKKSSIPFKEAKNRMSHRKIKIRLQMMAMVISICQSIHLAESGTIHNSYFHSNTRLLELLTTAIFIATNGSSSWQPLFYSHTSLKHNGNLRDENKYLKSHMHALYSYVSHYYYLYHHHYHIIQINMI